MGCQEGKAYRAVLLEGDSCFSVLALLLAFTTQPRKKSNHKGDESTYDIVRRMSSPRAWDVAFVPFPEDFAPLPSQAENWLGMPCQLEFSPSFFFARVWALCAPRGTSHRVEFRWGVRGMSLTIKTSSTEPNTKNQQTNQKQPTSRTKGQAQVRTSLKEQKVQIRGPTQW